MQFRLLAPVIILAGGCLMAISLFVPYLLDDGTNAFIQARHNMNFHGHYGEFFPGAIIAALAVGSGVVALGAMAAWVGRATSASWSPAASRA